MCGIDVHKAAIRSWERSVSRKPSTVAVTNLAGIDANLILALDALLDERNVTRAAARLGVGQPAMSHSLARLREHFSDPLLIPRGRELVLTRMARTLVLPVATATAALATVFDRKRSADPRTTRTFVMAAADLFATRFVPPVLRDLERDVSEFDFEVRPLASRSTEQILSDGVDLAVGVFEDVPAIINQEALFQDHYVCVVRTSHPRVGRTLSLATYLDLPHVEVAPAPNARPGERIDRWLAARGHQRRRVPMRVPFFALAARVVAEHDHVLTMTESFAHELADRGALRIVRCPVQLAPLTFSQIWHRRHDDDQAHAWLRAAVSRVCRDGSTSPNKSRRSR
jgi:DNA-binding transcriptional LysR family regulator